MNDVGLKSLNHPSGGGESWIGWIGCQVKKNYLIGGGHIK